VTVERSSYWRDLTTEDASGLDADRWLALLPMGAVEQHGPHLPLDTDACIAEGVAAAAMRRLPDDVRVLVLPTVVVGSSDEHTAFPGTLSYPAETLIAMLCDLGAGVARAGLRKLVILNAHGGQPQMVDIAALRLRLRHRMLVIKANTFRFGMPQGLFDDAELRHGFHGGAIETSMMLHLCPERVRMDRAADFQPLSVTLEAANAQVRPGGAASFAWMAQDQHVSGAIGDATLADAGKGRHLIEYMADVLIDILRDASRFPLSSLRDGS
jgi:creatinine amidohydrolase